MLVAAVEGTKTQRSVQGVEACAKGIAQGVHKHRRAYHADGFFLFRSGRAGGALTTTLYMSSTCSLSHSLLTLVWNISLFLSL